MCLNSEQTADFSNSLYALWDTGSPHLATALAKQQLPVSLHPSSLSWAWKFAQPEDKVSISIFRNSSLLSC